MTWEIRVGDCRVLMSEMDDCSVDSVVCDPPYELNFMGKGWDASGIAYDQEVWKQALRVLKPGGHLLAFSGSRTYHRMTCAIEDSGFEIRDQIMWVYGSGFPKSHDVSKAIDRHNGDEREVTGKSYRSEGNSFAEGASGFAKGEILLRNSAASAASAAWQGWGTALKPAHEPICVARKPPEGTVANNVLKHGVGGLNIDSCRVGNEGGTTRSAQTGYAESGWRTGHEVEKLDAGRFPANLIHDGSDEVVSCFPETSSGLFLPHHNAGGQSQVGTFDIRDRTGEAHPTYGDSGSAARFFYAAKASVLDRNEGLDDFADKASASAEFRPNHAEKAELGEDGNPYGRWQPRKNIHPTVKPTDLMRYLCRLVTPPGGLILDPFSGSGSTGKGAVVEGFNFIGCELSDEYAEIARARIAYAEGFKNSPELLGKAASKPKKYDFNLFE